MVTRGPAGQEHHPGLMNAQTALTAAVVRDIALIVALVVWIIEAL